MSTGFNAYSIYCIIKNVHFGKGDFDATKNIKYFKKKFLDKWNTKRSKEDGYHFLKIEKKYPNSFALKLLFSIYYVEDENFYIKDIETNNYKTFNKYVYELKNIKKILTQELECVIMKCKKDGIKFESLFQSKGNIPEIYNLGLSYNILVILNRVINITRPIKNLNILEQEVYHSLVIKIKKYDLIIDRFIKNIDYKQLLKTTYKNVTLN